MISKYVTNMPGGNKSYKEKIKNNKVKMWCSGKTIRRMTSEIVTANGHHLSRGLNEMAEETASAKVLRHT